MPIRIPFVDKFPVKVFIFQKRGDLGATVIKADRARYIGREGKNYYELKSSGQRTRPVPYDYYTTSTRGKPILFFYEYSRGEFVPVDINSMEYHTKEVDGKQELQKIKLKIIDDDVAFWGQWRRRSAEQRHTDDSWWARNRDLVFLMAQGVFMIVLAYIFMQGISDTGNGVIEAFKQVTNMPPG